MTMDDRQQILRIEALCKDLYESTDATQRSQAQEALVAISNSDNCLTECQFLLEHSTSPYAQMFASQSLIKLISRTTSSLPLNHRLEMRNYLLNYLATRLKLTNFVAQALMKLLARITKYSWFEMQKEQYVFQTVVNDVMNKFLQGNSIDTCVIGIQILTNLIIEMNQVADPSRSFAKQRKVAASFRDSVLLDMFNVACSFLKQLTKKPVDQNNQEQVTLVSSLLQLTVQVLSFDFIGSCIDEASDDVSTVQIPTSWRQAFLDGSLLDLFFNLYGVFNSSLTALSLSCLVHLASVRRSLFNNNERPIYLNSLVQGIRSVLEKPQYLSDPSCYHEFCRLLARLKSNYQLGELVKVDNYSLVIDLIAKFTVTSVQEVWQCAPNSVHYLLGLWQRFVASLPYVKSSSPHHLNEYSPQITKAYVTSRLESVQLVIRDGLEDPMEDYHVLEQQLEQLSTIARCDYDQTCSLVMSLFDQAASSYQECLQQQSQRSDASFVVYEGQLAWLVCIIGSVVAGRTLFYIAEESDILDGELICRVLQLMKLLEERNPQVLSEKLDLAILSFFEQFRKIYIGDQMQKTAKVYSCIGERLGLKDESMVLSIFINKISVRKIVKLESIQFVLKNHTEQHFPFLGIQPNITLKNMRHRTLFYTAIGRFLMVDLGEDDESFVQFFMPLTLKFEQFKNQIASTSVNEEQVKRTIIGLCRDIRGLGTAFVNRSCYMMLFDWLYPAYMPALIRAVELWYHDPSLTTPVLKLVTEIVQNRSQRLQFEVSSPNGVLLFREVSKIICTYGSRVLLLNDIPERQIYAMKYPSFHNNKIIILH
ncbi:Exportin-7 [Trichoplax sp. H2]|nr:Exportin-7 [Trichoplax sp. H2]|eukprot:RDD45555.1 Exportin-7 [Trichoplax sp. H2]